MSNAASFKNLIKNLINDKDVFNRLQTIVT